MFFLFVGQRDDEARGMESYAGAYPTLEETQQLGMTLSEPDGSTWAQIARVAADGGLEVVCELVRVYEIVESEFSPDLSGGTIGGWARDVFRGYHWADPETQA